MSTTYRITLSGCDDSTSIDVALTKGQHAFLGGLVTAFEEASTYSCMPIMAITPAPPEGEAL